MSDKQTFNMQGVAICHFLILFIYIYMGHFQKNVHSHGKDTVLFVLFFLLLLINCWGGGGGRGFVCFFV